MEVDACVTCSAGISIELPVTIYEPQPATWEVQVPPGWNPTRYVTAQVVLPFGDAANAVAAAAVAGAAVAQATATAVAATSPQVTVKVNGVPARVTVKAGDKNW